MQITREEFKFMAVGEYVYRNPTAAPEQLRIVGEAVLWAWDYQERKKREQSAKTRYETPTPLRPLPTMPEHT